MAIFLGLHSSLIHFVSTVSISSPELSSVTDPAILLDTSIPTPPPLLVFFLFFAIHLYPFMLILLFPPSFVSDISAISIFSVWSRDSRLLIFPLIPRTLIAAIFIVLFFLILGLFFFFFFSG